MLDILSENRKLVIILFIAAVLIIIGIIWIPDKDNKLSYYDEISEEERDKMVIKEYGDKLQFALYSNDSEFLKNNVLDSYLTYNEINKEDYYNWLLNNDIVTNSIKFGQTTKYEYGKKNIYTIDAKLNGISQKINIIEDYPENWKYTLGTFINYIGNENKKQYKDYGVTINSIYQDINYIEFDVSLNVLQKSNNSVDIAKSDSVKLVMDDNTSVIMATNDYTSETTIINGREYTTIKCIFNISIDKQADIKYIKFDAFTIQNEEKNIRIDLEL